ncbi:hypothetical protein EAF00_009621 [Botryotinia globosa]|nr:hypothetical protein EAF00_009621 [Botryotinia globosa]
MAHRTSFLNLQSNCEDLTTFVVISVSSGDKITEKYLQHFRSLYLDPDDIFQPVFLSQIVFWGVEEDDVDLQPSALYLLAKWNTKERYFVASRNRKGNIAPDPSLTELDNTITANQVRVVVPSRSYSIIKPPDKTLAGVRIAVKHIFNIKGFKTSLCNQAWNEYHAPKSKTARSVQRLQDLDAVVIGKTRLNAMITPSVSSSGSYVAVAAYPWLDFTLGSNTNGSCRRPAYWMGCFAIRPTTRVLDMHGVASFCPYFVVPAFFGREISCFREFANLWYGSSPQLTKSGVKSKAPSTIIYLLDYFPASNKAQMDLIDSFVRDLEGFLGVRKIEVSLAEMWRDDFPKSAENIELSDYLETAGTLPYYKDACAKLDEEQADKTTPEARDKGWECIYTYRKWLLANVFKDGAIVVLPIDEGKPNNRENPPP